MLSYRVRVPGVKHRDLIPPELVPGRNLCIDAVRPMERMDDHARGALSSSAGIDLSPGILADTEESETQQNEGEEMRFLAHDAEESQPVGSEARR